MSGFNFGQRFVKSVTPGSERGGYQFDQRFLNSVTRRLHSVAGTPEARDDQTFNLPNMTLKIPNGKMKQAATKEEPDKETENA